MISNNILFVIPRNEFLDEAYQKNYKMPITIPYGVLSIASFLTDKSNAFSKIKVLDLTVIEGDIESVLQRYLASFKPTIVAISAMTTLHYPYLKKYFSIIKTFDSNIFTILGGIVATNLFEKALDDFKELDAVCYAEGELPFLKLLESTSLSAGLEASLAWITRETLGRGIKPQVDFVDDLDQLPFIDFSFVNIENYSARGWLTNYEHTERMIALPIHTTRGCPFDCVFCCAAKTHGKRVRKMSADRVIEHIGHMKSTYGMNVLSIDDDQFLIDQYRAKSILRQLEEFNLSVEAESGVNVRFIDEEMALLMERAGFKSISIAVESGSDFVLRNIMKKPLDTSEIRDAITNIRKTAMMIKAFLVVGLPGETDEHRAETVHFIKEVGVDSVSINVATPYQGSELYDICVKENYIDSDQYVSYIPSAYISIINTPDYSAEAISRKAYLMNLELNFINNYNLKEGRFDLARIFFESVISKYPNHAVAYYCLVKNAEAMGVPLHLKEKYQERMHEIIIDEPVWRNYADELKLEY